jgi:hypothetical protein
MYLYLPDRAAIRVYLTFKENIMKKNSCRFLLAGAALALSLQQAVAGDSGFIADMPELTQDADRAGAMIWVKPDVDRAAYTRVMIEPITIFISPDSKYQGLSADELKKLADDFVAALTKELEPEIPVVSQAGPGVLYVRAALTNVEVKKKKRGLLGYTPVGLVAGAVTGPHLSLKNAVLEIESLDAVSNERVGVLIDKAPTGAEGEELSWDSINQTFAFYAKRFKERTQAAQ